jgi:putative transposase
LPLITPSVEAGLYAYILDKYREMGCNPLAIGGIEDHVHLMVSFPATLEIAKLIKDVKGASSHLMTHELTPGIFFKWQGAYGAFTVSKSAVPDVADYIKRQKAHHNANNLLEDLEKCELVYAEP